MRSRILLNRFGTLLLTRVRFRISTALPLLAPDLLISLFLLHLVGKISVNGSILSLPDIDSLSEDRLCGPVSVVGHAVEILLREILVVFFLCVGA
jgi:hypothetical protein